MKTKIKLFTAIIAIVGAAIATQASAGGFFGDLVNQVAPGVGTQLDRWHKGAGQPLDTLGAQAGSYYTGVPMGNFCATQVGVFHGPILPVGAPCRTTTPQGFVVYGFTAQ